MATIRKQETKEVGQLLLSLYAYLYQVAGVPHYSDGAYLDGVYEMLEEWLQDGQDDYDAEIFEQMCHDFKVLRYCGGKLLRAMKHPFHLSQWEQRLDRFVPQNVEAEKIADVIGSFFQLWKQYPMRSIMDNIHERFFHPDNEDRVYPDNYISFYWGCNDSIYETLYQTVNSQLQEMYVMEGPIAMQLFNQPQISISDHVIDFESRFFELITQLTQLL